MTELTHVNPLPTPPVARFSSRPSRAPRPWPPRTWLRPPAVHAAGNSEIRIGMIGCGGRCSGAADQALSLGSRCETGRHVGCV